MTKHVLSVAGTANMRAGIPQNSSSRKPSTHQLRNYALEFPDDQIVLLASLCEGQQETVLQLPAEPKSAIEREAQHAAEYVADNAAVQLI